MAAGSSYRFGEFHLDLAAGWLRRGNREVELPPKAFQVLCYLVEHHDRLVPKQELMEKLWKDTFVTDDALVQAVTAIRRAFGDDAEQPRYIRTKPRVGYQFVAPVEVEAAAGSEVPATVVPVSRSTARKLFLLIQAGYLALYAFTLYHLDVATQALTGSLQGLPAASILSLVLIIELALGGIAVRLYLIAAVAFDHPQSGRGFERLFPGLFVLDLLWALVPLLLMEKTGLLAALVLVPVLAYAPFSQRTLIRTAYVTPVVSWGGRARA